MNPANSDVNYEHSVIPSSLRKRVFKLLDKNPILKPLQICELLHENYKERGAVITQYKKQWKKEYKSERGLIRSFPDEVHNVFYKGVLPSALACDVRGKVLPLGWRVSRSRNRFLLFKNVLGRVRFFENGTVELFVRKPASDGKCMQLFSQAFVWTKLVDSISVVEAFQKTLVRRMHCTFDTGQRLPYMKVTAFEDTHKLGMVLGDKSHPTCAEFWLDYHAEVETARRLFEQMAEFFGAFSNGKSGVHPLKQDYSS